MQRHSILFLAANPAGLPALRLDEEARDIQDEIRRTNGRDRFELVPRLAAQPMDLLRALREVRPSIVHFAGHASADGIYFVDERGQPKQVTREALEETIGAAGQSVQIVVLNGCATEKIARALCGFVPICVGTSSLIDDAAARVFSIGWYGALASGESATRAFSQGKAAMHLKATGGHDQPRLHQRDDIDPAVFVLTDRWGAWTLGFAHAIAMYRKRKKDAFARWDLRAAGPAPTTGNRPTEITLDEMYIPLRFGPEGAPGQEAGAPLHPADLLQLRKPQVVIGAAGTGKTTWMRWTFRRLLENSRAVPFFLELRKIAAAWETPRDAACSIESYLTAELEGCGEVDPEEIVRALLADASSPHPVLLIDGWDELGAQGERLRERLVELCRMYPRITVVVSSRPYGDSRPASAESFETVYIQSLWNSDVRLLAERFHRRVYGYDEPAGVRATDEFMAALAAAPDARSLAGTALLLTMMLLLSREGPLPDRRHKLYTACLRNMLLHRVAQRERDGVVIDLDQQWRPDDSEERLRVVAEFAYRMQAEGYERLTRRPIVRGWEDAITLLGSQWARDQRERFLRWLVASAGLLMDRTDGSVQFAHLSFQEHLAAYYLFISREGDARLEAVRSHMGDQDWWETLRLWAALVGDQWPEKLSGVFDALRASEHAYWLAGQIFADGTGRSSDFEAWAAALPARLAETFAQGGDCASAWRASKQADRRAKLTAILVGAAGRLSWLEGTWHADWAARAGLVVPVAPALRALEASNTSAAAVARSRVLLGTVASWPDGGAIALLRLWPAIRAGISVRLQTAISVGANRGDLAPSLIAMAESIQMSRVANPDFTQYITSDLHVAMSRNLASDSLREFWRCFGRFLSRAFFDDFAGYVIRYVVRYVGRRIDRGFTQYSRPGLASDFGANFLKCFAWDGGQHFIEEFVRSAAHKLTLDPSATWLTNFATLELGTVPVRASVRASLAGISRVASPLIALAQSACQASFAPDDASLRAQAARACDTFEGDPLWPALARHIARLSTAEDRALLEALARHPEQREPPLSWGLQHYVRGDLVLNDDSVVTLDDLCAQAGIPPLPLLEDMPDELELPLDEPTSAS